MQNGLIERLNRSNRTAVPDMHVFKVLEEIRERTDIWMQDCNEELLHNAPGDQMPSSTDSFATRNF